MWRNHYNRAGDIIHIVPTADLVAHELTADCVCGPRSEITPREGHRDQHLYVHAALDGREQRETQRREA